MWQSWRKQKKVVFLIKFYFSKFKKCLHLKDLNVSNGLTVKNLKKDWLENNKEYMFLVN